MPHGHHNLRRMRRQRPVKNRVAEDQVEGAENVEKKQYENQLHKPFVFLDETKNMKP